MMISEDFSAKTVLVTGGGRGIGRAISEAFASLGATVIVNYSRSAEAAQAVVSGIRERGGRAETSCFDVSDSSAVDAGVKAIVDAQGSIDVLVNNAGIAIDGLLARTKDDDWARTISVNLSGVFFCSRAVSKVMMKKRSGVIVNISSVIGETGNAGQSAYAASKSGIFGFTKSLAKELGSRNVTVNAITPGYISTDMTRGISDDAQEEILKSIPLGRLGESEDVAGLAVFLASRYARYITGQIIGVNGGMSM